MRTSTGAVAIALALALLVPTAHAVELDVQPGDDLYSLTENLGAGDVVTFADGVYELDGTLSWSEFTGTVDQPVELRAAPDATPILRQIGEVGWVAELRDSQNVIVRGLTFEGGDGWETAGFNGLRLATVSDVSVAEVEVRNVQHTGLVVTGDCTNVQVTDTEIHSMAEGHGLEIGCWDAGCFVQNSSFSNNWIHDLFGDGADGIRLLNGSQGDVVLDNMVHDVSDGGVYLGSTESGDANVLEGNGIWNVVGYGVYIEGAAMVRNNVIARVGGRGIQTHNGGQDDLDDVVITHNTVAETGSDAMYLQDVYFRSGIVIANNVLANPMGYGLRYSDEWDETSPPSENQLRNNVVTGLVRDLPEDVLEAAVVAGGGFTDFLDAENLDFYPVGSGVMVDAADASGDSFIPELDFNGLARDGANPDAGAYEWTGEGNPGAALVPGFKGSADPVKRGQSDVGGGCCSGKGEGKDKQALLLLPMLLLAGFRRRR